MRPHALVLVLLTTLFAVGCPGAKPPAVAPQQGASAVTGRIPVSKSGLGFRVRNADESSDLAVERAVTPSSPLGKSDADRLLARLPKLTPDPEDTKVFSMRAGSIAPPRTGKTVQEPFPPPPDASAPPRVAHGPLTIERHAPEGPVTLAPNVSLTFSEPMVPVTSLAELAKGSVPARLSPEPEGTWQWLGTQTLVFQPKTRLPMATMFTVTVPEGTKAESGNALAQGIQWTFQTPPPTLKTSLPIGGSVRLTPVLFAEFDQAIDPAVMLKSIELVSRRGTASVRLATQDEIDADDAVRGASERAEKGRWLAFVPTTQLSNATKYAVHVKPGAKGTEGPLPTTQEQAHTFETFGPFEVTEARCAWGDQCRPLQPFAISFSNDIDKKTMNPSLVTVSPEIPGMKVAVQGSDLVIVGRTKGRTKYEVTIGARLGDVHGQLLGSPKTVSFDVGPAESELFAPERDMVVLDPASPKKYVVYTLNEPELRTRVYAVTPQDWKAFVAYQREWQRPRKLAVPGRLVVDKRVRPEKAPDALVATPIDLSPALAAGFGHAIVVVESTRPRKRDERPNAHEVWVQATDLGVRAFLEPDRASAFVTKLTDGAPIDGVDVSLVGGASSAKTKDGLATLSLTGGGYPLVAKHGRDVAFVVDDWNSTDTFAQRRTPQALRWFVFTDRGMYKPGEEVHAKGWVRRADLGVGGDLGGLEDLAHASAQYTVRDPRGAELTKGTLTLDDQGAFDLAFQLPANANLGTAHIQFSLPSRADAGEAHHAFAIQEFRKPEYEVKATTSEGPNFVGGHATATVMASYYAGGGLPDAATTWDITRSTTTFRPPNRTAYHFGPEPRFYWSPRVHDGEEDTRTETWTSRTNAQGAHSVRLDFEALEPSYPMSLALTASVTDVNHQQWAARTQLLVHPSDRYVGVKLAKNFVKTGENLDVELVATDLDGKLAAGRPISVRFARIDFNDDGEEEVEADVQTCDLTSSRDEGVPLRCSFQTKEGGRHRVTAIVLDEQGRRNQSVVTTWVVGGERPNVKGVDAERVTVIADKPAYEPGETAKVLVAAPFVPAEGVLTVRRQGIVHLERFTMTESSRTFDVKLDDAMVPNVTIAVDLVGASLRENTSGSPDPKLPKRPAYASGSQGVKVLPTTRTLAVKATPARAKLDPGGSTRIDVEVKDPSGKPQSNAEVALVVVDEAVLALSSYKTPDPLDLFYAPRAEDVRAIGNRERIILGAPSTFEGGRGLSGVGEGGGGRGVVAPTMAAPAPSAAFKRMAKGEAMMAEESAAADSVVGNATSAIAVRTNFAALALFAPRVRTDAGGRATVSVKVPDNLTRYRVMAVASSGNKFFGSNESSITARLPLMVRPSAPRFLNFGDTFELPVVIQNQTDAPVEVGVVVRGANATLTEPSAKHVKIAPNDRAEVRFLAKTVKPGRARFQIGVASPSYADASEVTLPVYTPATTEAFATYGEVDNGAAAQPVKMPAGVFEQFGGLEVQTSSTQLQALTDAMLYLVKYPFDCNEQIASRVLAVSALRDVLSAFKAEGMPSPAELEASTKDDFAKLARTQHANGGWGFWQEVPWPFLSVHVTHALVRAKEKGYAPNQETLRRAQGYLQRIEGQLPAWYGPDARRAIVAYALYVRNRLGDADPARARRLIQEAGGVDKLPIEALGWLWPTLAADKASSAETEAIRRFVANHATETAGTAHFVTGYGDGGWVLLHSDRRVDGVLLEAMIGDQPSSTLIPKIVRGLLAHRKAGRWTNTQENAFVLLALDKYFSTYEKVTPDFVARVWLGDKFAGEHAFKGRTTEQSDIQIPMRFLAANATNKQNVTLAKDGPGRLYYRIGMRYAPTDLKQAPMDRGFAVSRTYEAAERPSDVKRDADGTWRVKLGAKVRVRVAMVSRGRRYHVALVDPLPAGLEPMNAALAVTGELPRDPKAEASAAKTFGPYWFWNRPWFEHQNLRDDRAEAFTSLLYDGVWNYDYVATATTPGTFVVPPPKAEEMYAPETFGRGASDKMIIE